MSPMISQLSSSMRAYAEAVISAQIVSEEAFEAWLQSISASGQALYDLAEQLPQSGLVTEFLLARDLAQHLGIPYMGDLELELYGTAHPDLSRRVCVEYGVLCVSDGPRDPLPMVVTNPLDEEVLTYIKTLVGAELKLNLASPGDLLREIDNCYGPEDEDEDIASPLLPTSVSAGGSGGPLEEHTAGAPKAPAALMLCVTEEEAQAQQAQIEAFITLLSSEQ